MNKLKYILITFLLLGSVLPLSTAEMWKFVPKDEFGGFIYQTEHYGAQQVVQVNRSKKYDILLFDGTNLQEFGTDFIRENMEVGSTEIENINNNLFLTSGANDIFLYTEDKEWKYLQFEDKYNAQDNKFRRAIGHIAHSGDSVYFLSYAMDVKSIDTLQNGIIETRLNRAYSEIFLYDGTKLSRKLFIGTDVLRAYDIATDGDGLWISARNGLYYMQDGKLKDSVDINSQLGFDANSIYSNIFADDSYVYLLKQSASGGAMVPEPYLVVFDKKTRQLEKMEFQRAKSYSTNEVGLNPGSFSEMVSYKGRLFIASSAGVYEYNNHQLSYVDIFSQFLPEIPEVFYKYLGTEDISISNHRFYISTNVGLIYTDEFTDVNDITNPPKSNLKLYPNIVSNATEELTLEAEVDMSVKSIELYDMSGKVVTKLEGISNIRNGINSLKFDYSVSGKYFLTIKTVKDNFIVPLIIKN